MMRRALARVSGIVLGMALISCGGGGGVVPPTPVATPAPCTQATAFQGSGPVTARTGLYQSFSTTTTGRLDVTVDWTFPASPVGVYVVPEGTCAIADFNARTCNFVIRSEPGLKPRKVSLTGVAAGAYELILANFATVDESMSATVLLSGATCPALAVTVTGAGGEHVESLTLTRTIRR